MKRRGAPCVCSWMMPIGKQCASGLSLLLPATRFFKISAPYGVNGAPPVIAPAISRKLATGGPAGGAGGAASAPRPPGPPPRRAPPANGAPRHRPDRSGLPSAVLGAGASTSTCPAAVFGTSGGIRLGHWADTDSPDEAKNAIRQTARRTARIKVLQRLLCAT